MNKERLIAVEVSCGTYLQRSANKHLQLGEGEEGIVGERSKAAACNYSIRAGSSGTREVKIAQTRRMEVPPAALNA